MLTQPDPSSCEVLIEGDSGPEWVVLGRDPAFQVVSIVYEELGTVRDSDINLEAVAARFEATGGSQPFWSDLP